MVRKSWRKVVLGVSLLSGCNIADKIQERIFVYVSGQVAAQLQAEAAVTVQERLLESLTGMDAEYQGDGKWVVIPIQAQPGLGENVTAPSNVNVNIQAAPRFFTAATTVSQTFYVASAEPGPDGTTGWYTREYNGYVFYYKTQPFADLSQRWPANVQTLWAGWRGAGTSYLKGYTWWLKSEVVSATHVRGEWHFDIGADAAKYAGTRYAGTYDYERVPDERVNTTVTGAMKLVNGATTRESYTHYSYAFTNASNVEAGRFYFGVGPAAAFETLPAWAAGQNPAGDEWTNDTQRPGLYQYQTWVDQAVSWWKYDGTSEVCSTQPAYLTVRGGGTVTAGKTLQLSAEAYNACNDRLKYRTITWASSNLDVATVSDAGLVSALAPGEAQMSASAGEAKASVGVTVRELDKKPAKVVISGGTSVQRGATLKLSATVYNKNNEPLEGVAVAWSSLNPAVAGVDAQGVVSGVADGSATIRATAGTVTGDVSMRVYDPAVVTSVSLYCPANRTVMGAAAVPCSATGYNYAGQSLTGTVFTWSSNNTAVLTVDSNGNVTPVAKGTATVTAGVNGKQQQITFVVYNQNDVSYVVVASANGSSLRIGDASFKLALTAKAYNYLGDEIPGVSFSWSSDNPAIAQATAGSPNAGAEVAAGASEGNTTIRAITPTSVVGTFTVGTWDNRVSSVQIVNAAFNSVSSIYMSFNANYQLYVRAYNANNRLIGYVTPTWTVPAGLAIDANGKLTAGATALTDTLEAAVPKGDGSGNAVDTLSVTVYDALKPTSLYNNCTSTYNIYAGGTQNCSVTSYNAQSNTIAGNPVTWYVSDPTRLTITSQNDTGSPGTVQFRVPPGLASGGSVTFTAVTACNGAPAAPGFANCVVSGQGTVNARGTQDINYVSIVSPASGTKVGVGNSTVLVAKAYDYQSTPQELSGLSFTFTRQSGTSFNAPNASGAVTAAAEGTTYFQATANPGGIASSSFGFYLQGVDPAKATVVNLTSLPAVVPTLRPYQTFTVWAAATNGLGQPIAGATFNFSTSNSRLEIMASTATTATLRFIRCDCANSATNSAVVYATYTGTGGAQSSRTVNVLNPVYTIAIAAPSYSLVPEGAPYTIDATVTGYDSQPAPMLSTVVLQENGTQAAYDVAGLDLVNLVYLNGNALAVNIYAEDASTASSRTATWYFYVDPAPQSMAGAASGSPALANGYLAKELYFFGSAADFAKAVSYATWATTGVIPERTYTATTLQQLQDYSSGYYGLRKLSTGEIVTSRIGVRFYGYVQLTGATLYLRTQSWERVRVTLGGVAVLTEWGTTGALSERAVKLTNLPTSTWLPLEIEGLMDAAQSTYNQKLGAIAWSTNGTSYYDTPASVGATLAQDP